MTADFEYRTRPGSLALSIAAFAGLTLLAAVVWTIAPVFALILMVPALLMCFYQIVVSPTYGLKVSGDGWRVFSEAPDRVIPMAEIDHVQFSEKPGAPRCVLALKDGTTVALPDQALPSDLMALIRETSARGLNIRQG
ncbi:MAG: hypothetical protein AAGF88_07825 [Pseudomonadota bacterium]